MIRRAFTLFEMLVAISIIAVLAALAITVLPTVFQRTKVPDGASSLQGWLLIARAEARHIDKPAGLRLYVDGDGFIRRARYIAQPNNIRGGIAQFDSPYAPGANPFRITLQVDHLELVHPGDVFQVGDYLAKEIASVTLPTGSNPGFVLTKSQLWDASSLPANLPPVPANNPPMPPYSTTNFSIIRRPALMAGEDIAGSDQFLKLPDGVVIDPALSSFGSLPSNSTYDILFTRLGNLWTDPPGTANRKVLWLRDPSRDADQPGEQLLIVVFSTGRVGGFPVGQSGNPYQYVVDPRNSGS